jgi:4-amino-4-deoxy-L-arabinose transferase-like glycosyltransferase
MAARGNVLFPILNKIDGISKGIIHKISMYSLNKKELCVRLLLLTIIIFGGLLRIYDLSSRPFLADEGISTMAAIDVSKTGYPPITPGGGTYWRSIFHTSTMAGFFQLFGISVFVARLPSVIFGTLTILLIYYFGKKLMNWKVGLISSFLLSINVLAIDLSREARMYSIFQFFYLLSLFFFYMGFEAEKGKTIKLFNDKVNLENVRLIYLLISAITFVISLMSLRLAAMIIPGIMGYAIIIGLINRKTNPNSKKILDKYLLTFILLIIVIIFGLLVGLSTGYRHQITSLLPFIGFSIGGIVHSTYYYGLYLLENFPIELSFSVIGIIAIYYIRGKNGAFLLASLIIPLLLQLLFFNFVWVNHKYIFHLIPLFLILSAYGIHELARYFKAWEYLRIPKNVRPRFLVVVLSLLLIFSGSSFAYLATQRGKIASPYWREACEYVLFNSQNDTSLVASVGIIPHFFLESDEYGLRPEYPEYAHKNITIFDRPYLHTREDLMNMTRTYDNGWVLVDLDRWNWDEVITEDAKAYLQENMTYHPYRYHMYLFIYSWGYE